MQSAEDFLWSGLQGMARRASRPQTCYDLVNWAHAEAVRAFNLAESLEDKANCTRCAQHCVFCKM